MFVNRRAVSALCCVASSLPWGVQAGGRSIGSGLASNTDIDINSKTSLRLHSTLSSASSRFTSAFIDSSRTFKGLSSLAFAQPSFASTTSNVNRNYTSNTKLAMSDNMVPQVKNRVALLQLPVTSDKSQNLATAKEYIIKAQQAGAKLCVLPEIWNSPYATSAFREYAEVLPNVDDTLSGGGEGGREWGPSSIMLMEMAMSTKMYIVGGSIPEIRNDKIYNTCLIINPAGRVVGKHRKVHLFDIDVPGGITFKESETLCAGQGATYFDVEESVVDDGDDNVGDESGLGRIGVGICYDIRFPEYALLLTQKHQCKILIYPGAFNLTTGPAHWELLQRGRAVDGQCYVLTASPARMPPPPEDSENKYPHYSAWGHSTVVSPWGEVVATCDEKPGMITADLDMSKVEEMRMAIPTSAQKRHDLYRLVDGDDSK